MFCENERPTRASGTLQWVSVVLCFAAVACSDIRPAPDDEGGGLLESPTHEQDALHEEEQRQEEIGRR
jgi:hypothetical protein